MTKIKKDDSKASKNKIKKFVNKKLKIVQK
jgi:hypothetical protein